MEENIFIIFGRNVKRLRTKSGFTLNQLSKKAKIDRTTLISIEKGIANPLFSTILKLSKTFKVHPSVLFENI